jgi:multiple sugar transport system substrate-binding protein
MAAISDEAPDQHPVKRSPLGKDEVLMHNPQAMATGRRRRPFRLFLASALALGTAVSGALVSTSTASASTAVTVTYLTHWAPPQVAMLQADANTFHKANPNITINFHAVPFGDLLSTLDTEGPSAGWTAANIYDLWLPELVQSNLAAPAPTSVSNFVKAGWPANLVADVTKGGAVRGVPNEVDLYALNYNKALFAKAGIARPPANWTQLLADAQKLTNKKAGIEGFGVITSWAAGVVHPWLSLVDSNGGQLLSSPTTPDLTNPKVEAVTKLYQELVKDGYTVASMSTANANTTGPYLDNFAAGKTAMIIMANWWESDLKTAMGPSFSDVGVAPIPVGPDGTKSSSVSYSWTTMVNSEASPAQQAGAWKFLQWLDSAGTGKSGSSAMGDVLLSMGILPSRTSDTVAFKAQLSGPFLSPYVAELKNATPFPTVLGGEQMTDTIQTAIESVIFGRASAASAMASAQSQVASILKSANS